MKRVYKQSEEEDLWSDYGDAYSAIRHCVDKRFPEIGRTTWAFHKAYITPDRQAYTVSAAFTRFDSEFEDIVMVSCNAMAHPRKEDIVLSCGERMPVELDPITGDYKPKTQTPDEYREAINEHRRAIDGLLQTETALSEAILESGDGGQLSERLGEVQREIIARQAEIEQAERSLKNLKLR
ncbi:hypothetical protein GCM10011445_07110 [Pseudocitrobacter faecalis]|uniref:hypothetical protein n=1 Tax=Pseudocitrobacter faecalis TaxID=1398493 RepID=UPI0016724232|nr:hypothetical protein [Pseudocitrobacter faecalis]GHD90679.1 hypothetical protein GCM10011445_07110 [Pseudocitrobacter faecalis]